MELGFRQVHKLFGVLKQTKTGHDVLPRTKTLMFYWEFWESFVRVSPRLIQKLFIASPTNEVKGFRR